MSNEEITIEALVEGPVEQVWQRWTEPDHITQWNYAADDWCCPSAENDLTPGGRYRTRMEAKDGSFGFDFEAVYDEIAEHEKLIYTLTDGRRVTTIFQVEGGATRVTTTFDAEKENPVDMQRQRWQAILNNFKRYAELSSERPKVRTCLWFDGTGEEAAEFYVSLLPKSVIETVSRPEPGKPAMSVALSLSGTPYMFLNGGPHFKLSPAASIVVRTADQAETDRLWSALLADGGEESQCAWLTDRFGVSWQIVPDALPRMLGANDRDAAGRAMQAMLKMKKIDIAALESAFRGDGDS